MTKARLMTKSHLLVAWMKMQCSLCGLPIPAGHRYWRAEPRKEICKEGENHHTNCSLYSGAGAEYSPVVIVCCGRDSGDAAAKRSQAGRRSASGRPRKHDIHTSRYTSRPFEITEGLCGKTLSYAGKVCNMPAMWVLPRIGGNLAYRCDRHASGYEKVRKAIDVIDGEDQGAKTDIDLIGSEILAHNF